MPLLQSVLLNHRAQAMVLHFSIFILNNRYSLTCKPLSFRLLSRSILFCSCELGIRNPMQSISRGIRLRGINHKDNGFGSGGSKHEEGSNADKFTMQHPMFAAIWVDFDDTETEWIKERGQPATSPIVEELNLGHVETGWSIRVRNRMGITCEDVLFAIYDFFASPLYVDELGEMHPRAVRIMEQQYFEKRRMGFFDLMEGYRKSDALLGATYFDGIHNDPESVERLKIKYNFHSSNLLLLRLGNC
ncbi:hypothetical protein AYX13_04650 [Cryptococcus neoformans]|nr:hypothetical protein AYX13_04650 [Cryptococcus neoformans var. grubii]